MNRLIFLLYFAIFCMATDAAEMKKKITFIVNPLSHEIKGRDVEALIQQVLDSSQFEYKVVYSRHAGHATKLAQEAVEKGADIVAAVGGDGTVNEVGKALIHSPAALAIIPVGSGNGLARHLAIPVGLKPALQALNTARPVLMDSAKINGKTFLGVAGIGFDARIAWEFSHFGKRGFFSYCQVALKEFSKYKPESYLITVDGKEIVKEAFILTFANCSQYGNQMIIAPQALLNDGLLDLVMIDRIPKYTIPFLFYKFKKGKIDHSPHFETIRFKELSIQKQSVQAHVDGEPLLLEESIRVSVQPASVKIMINYSQLA